ncbi:MAG: histidine phosphatase family protein [Leptolyngbyaceae cyanobacterium bins.59]|nr:histidine phosphatase family protein [Leptolyngbyaceae cyanobacterium bins.59]
MTILPATTNKRRLIRIPRCLRSLGAVGGLAIVSLAIGGCGTLPLAVSQSSSPVVSSPAVRSSSSPPPAKAEPSPTQVATSDLWLQLQQGKGFVVLFRHALAPGTGDPPEFRLNDCSTQRNLSAEGRQQAIRIGEAFRQRNIPVARVLSSQWCRCLETARLMNVGRVESFPVLNSFFQNRSTERSQTEQLRQFILKNHDTKGVIILVTHQVNITAISNIVPPSGAAVVMRASTPNQVQLVGELDPL